MPNEINLAKLAQYWETKGLHMTWRRYRQIAKDGRVPEPQKGVVDALEALSRLAAYYQGMAEGDGDTCLTDEKKRKTKAEADIAEMERDVMAGTLVNAEEVKVVAFNTARTARDNLMNIPDRISPILAAEAEEGKVRAILAAEIRQALEEFVKILSSRRRNVKAKPGSKKKKEPKR